MRLSRVLHCKVGVLGVPMRHGQRKRGVETGPAVLRDAGILDELRNMGLNVTDHGDVSCNIDSLNISDLPGVRNWGHMAACTKSLSDSVLRLLQKGDICVNLGGDHSIGLGSVDGHARNCDEGDVALLWIDAHADLNTHESSCSGNGHGMPVSLLVKEIRDMWPQLPGLDWQQPRLTFDRLAYIGLRSVDSFERMMIEKYHVAAFGMDDVARYGINNVIHMALNRIDPMGKRSLHVSFDIDSLDSIEAPSTGTPVRGGLTLREALEIMEVVYATRRLRVLDVVEVNPKIGSVDDVHVTVEAAKQVVLAAFGHKRQGAAQLEYNKSM